ncbi:substrate-binding periplasmic protein [Thalassospira sp. SM2505]|nr:transporter substrate-binding domain-containing protein [Thalassospira profundimaris]
MIITARNLFMLLALICAPFLARADHTLVITTNIYPPYVQENVENSFLPALFYEIGKIMGVTFEVRIEPWKRGEQSVINLDAWGTFPYTLTQERKDRFALSDPIYFEDSRFFAYRDPGTSAHVLPPETYEKLDELKRWHIGGIQGYFYEQIFAEAGIAADYALNESQNFERLKLGRIDLFPAATTVGWYLINQLFPPEIAANFYTLDPPLIAHAPLFLMTSKDYPDNDSLLVRFNTALAEIRQNGTFNGLIERFGLVMRY